uniref:hypothetical protein n=1 Tax=Klebsiella variicola TaxID=244366 RepID=UPI001ABCD014
RVARIRRQPLSGNISPVAGLQGVIHFHSPWLANTAGRRVARIRRQPLSGNISTVALRLPGLQTGADG